MSKKNFSTRAMPACLTLDATGFVLPSVKSESVPSGVPCEVLHHAMRQDPLAVAIGLNLEADLGGERIAGQNLKIDIAVAGNRRDPAPGLRYLLVDRFEAALALFDFVDRLGGRRDVTRRRGVEMGSRGRRFFPLSGGIGPLPPWQG